MFYSTIFVIFLFGSVACQNDLTTQKGSTGSDVVEAVLDRIRSKCIFRDDRLFLRRLAFVATGDGNDKEYENDKSGGIWKVPRSGFNSIFGASILTEEKEEINRNFGVQWSRMTYDDLDVPLNSALAAHLLIEKININIKASKTEQAEYYALNWKDGFDRDNHVQTFTSKSDALPIPACSKAVDLVFSLDESGSVGSHNFERMKQFLSNLTEELTIGSNAFDVGAVIFNSYARELFPLNKYQTKAQIQNALITASYYSGGTSIGNGIRKAQEVFKNSTRKDATRALLLLTDGQSNYYTTKSAADAARNESSIVIFALGIGSINHNELDAAANEPTCTHKFVIADFNEIDSILYQIIKSTCGVSKPIDLEDDSKVEVEVEITEDSAEDTLEVSPGDDPQTSVEVEVECAVVDVYASVDTNKPNEAFYTTKGTAKEGSPAVLVIDNHGKKVYVAYKGNKLKLERCSTGGLNITVEVGAPEESVVEIICRENGNERECKETDFVKVCSNNAEAPSSVETCKTGDISADPTDKSRYRHCVHSKWMSRPCAPGLEFNNAIKNCDFP